MAGLDPAIRAFLPAPWAVDEAKNAEWQRKEAVTF
jgi:hypothetical protein